MNENVFHPYSSDKREVFAELIRQHGEAAYNFAYRLAGNEQDARDLVQEAFLRALRNFDKYDSSKPFEAWLTTILRNIFFDGVKRYERKHSVSLDGPAPKEESQWEEILPSAEPSPADIAQHRERDQLVQQALNSLPLHYKTAVILCDIEKMPYEEISKIMSCPVGTVRSRIHQGRVLLKEAFNKLNTVEVN
ncbi:hypothetical protein BVX98_07385 [bacterium F11]|nr:hypothetical protein BVX98_07385 [bacterium F11]